MKAVVKMAILGPLLACAAAPAFGARQIMDNAELNAISAKATNQATISGNSFLNELMNTSNGSIQVGYYQWADDHTNDASNHKGANDQSGANSQVQANVAASINALVWGSAAQVSTVNTAPVHGDQVTQAWSTMFLGGF